MTPEDRLRIVQLGAGSWGLSWTRLLAASADCRLVGLVDPDRVALERVGQAADVPPDRRFPSLAAALSAVEADAALIVVPPPLHAPVALEVLDAELHCLIEKPFAPTLAEAEAVVARAVEVDRHVMVSQNFRFRCGAETVRRLLADGAIGRVGMVSARFFRAAEPVGFRREIDEPLLLDMAVHHFDQLRAVVGLEPVRVWARSFNPPWSPFRGNAAAVVELESDDGAVVSYVGSWVSRGLETPWEGVWEVTGDRGTIVWAGDSVVVDTGSPNGGRLARRVLRRRSARRAELVALAEQDRLGVLAELARAVGEGRDPASNGRENLGTLAVTLAAVEAARRGTAVDLRRYAGT